MTFLSSPTFITIFTFSVQGAKFSLTNRFSVQFLPNYLLLVVFTPFSSLYNHSFFGQGETNSIAKTDGGPWPDKPPLDPPLARSS